ncbi:MAG: hypothetical protein IPL78_05530 [Chloroflexi bacterium]|nr:hypothetical protein [Chloroflexota bacterium]
MIAGAALFLTIELGGMRVSSASTLGELLAFMAGLLFLTGLTAILLRWNRRTRPDPFI